jgi:hypothetical protein
MLLEVRVPLVAWRVKNIGFAISASGMRIDGSVFSAVFQSVKINFVVVWRRVPVCSIRLALTVRVVLEAPLERDSKHDGDFERSLK